MKILQINNYGYLRGGSEKVFLDTTELLRKNGHEVETFTCISEGEESIVNGTQVKVIPWNKRKGFIGKIKGAIKFVYKNETAQALEKIIKKFQPDIVHLHIYYGRLTNSIVSILKKYNIPIVQSVHEYRLLCPAYTCLDSQMQVCEQCASSKNNVSCVKKRCLKGSLPLSIVAAFECSIRDTFFNNIKIFSKFIMVSEFIKNLHEKYFPEIREKTVVLYNSIDINKYASFRNYDKDNYILYLGRLSKEKGIPTLIKAVSNFPELNLKIAGTGPLKQEIETLIKDHGLRNVEMCGYVSGNNLYSLVSKAKFVIVPSEWYENNPLSIIESFALGTPVIASKIGGIPELVIDGKTGFLFSPKNENELIGCIREGVTLSSDNYRIMVESCIKFAEINFNSNNYYKSLMNIYDSAINQRN